MNCKYSPYKLYYIVYLFFKKKNYKLKWSVVSQFILLILKLWLFTKIKELLKIVKTSIQFDFLLKCFTIQFIFNEKFLLKQPKAIF